MTDHVTQAAELVEQLRALHVWPQFVADEHAGIVTPRQAKGLYAVGATAHEAADLIERLSAELTALEAENARAAIGRT